MSTLAVTYSVTDLRHKTSAVLQDAGSRGYVYLVRHSKPMAAIVDVDYLTALQEVYEDYLDTLEFDATVKEKRISLEKHRKRRRTTS